MPHSNNFIKQLGLLLKISKNQEDNASLTLKKAQAILNKDQQTLENLIHYRKQYHQQMIDSSKNNVSTGHSLVQYAHFMTKLEVAEVAQREKIATEKIHYQEKYEFWLKQHTHSKKLEILLEKHQDSLNKAEEKKAQKELDELIMTFHYRSTD